jgi:hypothetical protein
MSRSSHDSAEPAGLEAQDDNYRARSKRFRFKAERDSRSASHDRDRDRKRRRHHTSSHGHRKRRRTSPSDVTARGAQGHTASSLPPDQAFRESLFDAMGDDEGAAFWENVYGQPIHNYPNTYQDEETGELEQMNDEEYATFVRRKMWEKSWEGIEAAKEEQRREREEDKKRERAEDRRHEKERRHQREDEVFGEQIEASLRRGERRKERKRWQELWETYLRRWSELRELVDSQPATADTSKRVYFRNKIAWPVETGKRKDVTREEVERFVRKGTACNDAADQDLEFVKAVKAERVRWHPDKVQHRYSSMEVDEETLKGVTATFQIIDDIWSDIRKD